MVTAIGTTNVSDASELLMMRSQAPNISQNAGTSQSFSDVLENVGNRNSSSETDADMSSSNVDRSQKPESVNSETEEGYEEAVNEVENEDVNGVDKKEDIQDADELKEYVTKVSEVVVQLAKVLNISPEQLVDAMEKAGITPEDLLNGEGITKLMIEINNLENPVDILMNSTLHEQFKDAMQVVEETINSGEFTELLNSEESVEIDFEQLKSSINEMTNNVSEKADVNVEEVVETDVTDETVEEDVNVNANVTDTSETTETTEDGTQTEGQQKGTETEGKTTASEGNAEGNSFGNQVNSFTTVIDSIGEAVEVRYGSVTADNIIRQISEQIKVISGNNMSSIELSLNPESLGKVNIQIVAKDGAITAQISTETEMARAAIEGNLATLREVLSEQNIKVDAVEVTIASHGFEQNDEASSKNQNGEQKKSGARNISLEDYFDEKNEDEEIIMQAEGSTISFSA